MAKANVTEVIDLESDDEPMEPKKNKKKNRVIRCINFKCKSHDKMLPASSFACKFYNIDVTKQNKRFICKECLETVLQHQDELVEAILEHKPLIKCEIPDHTNEYEISDSDESDNDSKSDEDDYVDEDALNDFEKKFSGYIEGFFKKYDVDYQIKEAKQELKNQWAEVDDNYSQLDKDITETMLKLDKLRTDLYSNFQPTIKNIEPLVIDDYFRARSSQQPLPSVATKKVTQSQMLHRNIRPQHPPPPPPPQPLPQAQPRPQHQLQHHPQAQSRSQFQAQARPQHQPQAQPQAQSRSQFQAQARPQHQPQAKPQPQTQHDSQPEILQEVGGSRLALRTDLPPSGQLVKPVPDIGDIVFAMKHQLFPWTKGKVVNIISKSPPMQYQIKLLHKKEDKQTKNLSGKYMAACTPSPVIIPVGTRVVAIFQDTFSSNFYSGVIAEQPKITNKFRYLVFFDDGYAQYVDHKDVFLICESSPRVWEDIPAESKEFVKKYLESYPERPMVKLQKGQVVKTEWNGKWWIARVREVDASLVQMHFDADNRTEWIYRGSARLGPLYLELMKANLRQQGGHTAINAAGRHRGSLANKNGPYVEYTSTATDEREALMTNKPAKAIVPTEVIPVEPVPQQSRAVAKKSTAKRPSLPESPVNNYTSNMETKSSHSIVYFQTQNKIQTKKYVAHNCSPRCVENISFTPDDLRGYSPLSIPLLCGWNRQTSKYPKAKKIIIYQAPCGVRLRSMEELHRYLRLTKCPMSVDLFEFDHWVHCLAEFVLDKCFVNIKDLSYGVENVPIPCVNEIDHSYPDTIKYTTKREPTDDVHINLDPEFLCCCDCEDDCADKSKCQCWQLTIQGATLGGRVANAAVGYVYKRLPEAVTTGIYECNSRCKCSVKTCLNRVVQHPLNLKLQVFKTAPRGWGIRCLNDIPLGSFICIYAGRLLTEQGANEGGKNYGDEYLAELDYVEVVEGVKEGYESEPLDPELDGAVPEDDDEADADYSAQADKSPDGNSVLSDDEYSLSKKLQKNNIVDVEDDDSVQSTSIRSRLRKRKRGDVVSDDSTSKDGHEKNEKDEDDARREPSRIDLTVDTTQIEKPKYNSVRCFYGRDESVYIMDAKTTGNIGRYLNHSCDPNVFVQNVFVDTHDVRFPWVAFFALSYIRAGQELTWNYSYDVGSIPGKVIICKCGSSNCRGRLL